MTGTRSSAQSRRNPMPVPNHSAANGTQATGAMKATVGGLKSVLPTDLMQGRNITFPETRPTRATFLRGFCSSNSTRLHAIFRAGKVRSTAALSMGIKRLVRG